MSLTFTVVSPGSQRSVALERQTVISASSHRHHIGQAIGHISLTKTIVSPSDHCPVALQRQTVLPTPGHRHHVAQPIRRIGLAIVIVSPTQDFPGNGKNLIPSVRNPSSAVAHCQPKMVNLIIGQPSDRVCNPNNSSPTCNIGCVRPIAISQACSPFKPCGGSHRARNKHSAQRRAAACYRSGWQC